MNFYLYIQLLKEIHPIAQNVAVTSLIERCKKSQKQPEELATRSHQRHDSQRSVSVIARNDIAVNIDRAIGISHCSMELSLEDEVGRVMQISECFIRWCIGDEETI